MGTLKARHAKGAALLQQADPAARISFGQVFTPPDVAQFMAVHLGATRATTVLDIGAGAGMLSHAVVEAGGDAARITAVEDDARLAAYLRQDPLLASTSLQATDFLAWAESMLKSGRRWDRIISNPPYVNFHRYDRTLVARLNRLLGVRQTAYTNLFAWFLLLAERLLAPGGRMVFITPTELLSTNYGRQALRAVCARRHLERLVVFEPKAEPFDGMATSACITVFGPAGAATTEVGRVVHRQGPWQDWAIEHSRADPADVVARGTSFVMGATAPPSAGQVPLGDLVRVSRGIATGSNGFFVLTAAQRMALDPKGAFTRPVLSKASQVKGVAVLDDAGLRRLQEGEVPCWLLDIKRDAPLTAPLRDHIAAGERSGVSERFLCKARRPWYAMEQQARPAAFLRVFGRDGLRAIPNLTQARTLACFHRMHPRAGTGLSDEDVALLAAWLESGPGQASARPCFRRYGRGLLKLEPRDAERIPVPDVRGLAAAQRKGILARHLKRLRGGGDGRASCDLVAQELAALLGHARQ